MELLLILVTALLFTAPIYIPQLFFLSYLAFIPLIYLTREKDYRHSFVIAWLIAIISSFLSFFWLYYPLSELLEMPFVFIFLILFLYILISSLGLAIWVILNKFLQPKNSFSPFIAAFTWASLEYLRFSYLNINPFNYLAYSQTSFSTLINYASLGGIFLISFLTVLIAGYLVKIYYKPSIKRTVPLVVILVLIFFILPFRLNSTENSTTEKIDIINLSQISNDIIFEEVEENTALLAEMIAESNNQYLFTPQNGLSFDLLRNNYYREKFFSQIESELESKFLQLGSKAATRSNIDSELKDSLFLLDDNLEIINRYDKISNSLFLTNFFLREEITSILNNFLNIDTTEVFRVKDNEIIELNNLKYLNLISNEIYNPLNFNGQNLDLNLIVHSSDERNIDFKVFKNYSWGAAVLRAAENRVSVLKTSREGYNGYITPDAKSKIKTISDKGVIELEVLLQSSSSYYQSNPERIAEIFLIITAFIFIIKSIMAIKDKH
ncbi:hypothetical protein [Halanaerobium hydrogeniformans]|uniref:Apolipoprotein N-acyltransferase N-terminal domain-containing protein n=1 Tax=Halanaerobium hydrogeniformans TaxID=656519 RepID=E4RLV0_HALHG|nr:hypothetical protein [Halanaerobium hydrogeniformans]ADQ15014.1 hypothetical protein Halsa_1589 [Halanaerobium hydrogeniformans]